MEINIYDAKAQLSRLVNMLISKSEEEIIICKNGKPVASLTAYKENKKPRRVGIAKGKMPSCSLEDFNAFAVADLIEKSL